MGTPVLSRPPGALLLLLAAVASWPGGRIAFAAEQEASLRRVSFVEMQGGRKVVTASAARIELRNAPFGPLRLGTIKTAHVDDLTIEIVADQVPDVEWKTEDAGPNGLAVRMEVGRERPVTLQMGRQERALYAALERAKEQMVRVATGGRAVVRVDLNGVRARLAVKSQVAASLTCARGHYAAQKAMFECHGAALVSPGRGQDIRAPLIRFFHGKRKVVMAGAEAGVRADVGP